MRRFLDAEVSPETLHRILESAGRAPSAHNRQPWRFAVVSTHEAKTGLAEAMGADFRKDLLADGISESEADRLVARSQDRITHAPVVVVLCLSMVDMDDYPDRKRRRAEFRMAMQSVALAGGQLLLAAHAEGLGAVWVCSPLFAQEAVQSALDLPSDWEPQGMILLGHPGAVPSARDRVPIEELMLVR